MKTTRTLAAIAAAAALLTSGLQAQWLNHPTTGIPRRPDGTANLTAPAPRTAAGTPDLSGIWTEPTGKHLRDLSVGGPAVLMQPWAEQLYKERLRNQGRDRPSAGCLPHSVTDFDALPSPRKILQTPSMVVMLFETFHTFREIFTDGRSLPPEREPGWFGYSVGRWEGETLVVDTVGLNEKTWLDDSGHPHSDALHIVERFRRVDFGHMQVELTIDDPKTYLKPWTVSLSWQLIADTELLDWVCENNKYFQIIPK